MSSEISLDTLTADTLAYVLSFVDCGTVVHSVARVSKALHAASRDPVAWAQMVVKPRTVEQLMWLVREFPSITIIDLHFRYGTVSTQLLEEIARCCSQLRYCPGVFNAVEDCVLPLARVELGVERLPVEQVRACLRSVSFQWPLDGEFITSLSQECPNITSLECEWMISNFPSLFPCLTDLYTEEEAFERDDWVEFIGSHPRLQHLQIQVGSGFAYNQPPFGDVPTSLVSLVFNVYEREVDYPLVAGIVACSPDLKNFHFDGPLCAELLVALSTCRSLKNVTLDYFRMFEEVTDDDVAAMNTFAQAVSLSYLRVGTRPFSKEMHSIFLQALHCIPSLPGCFTLDDVLVGSLQPRLSHLRVLHLDGRSDLTVESCRILGSALTHLREARVRSNMDFAEAHYTALAPAFANLQKLYILRSTAAMAALVSAAAQSPMLEVFGTGDVEDDASGLWPLFIDLWDGRLLQECLLPGGGIETLGAILTAVRSGRLCSRAFPEQWHHTANKDLVSEIAGFAEGW